MTAARWSPQEYSAWADRRLKRASQRQPRDTKPVLERHAGRLYPIVALCAANGLPEPMPEYSFHPGRGWRFDYAWPAQRIALEIEGGIWRRGGGAHSHPSGILRDMEKYNSAAVLGWRVLRVQPDKLGQAIAMLTEMLT